MANGVAHPDILASRENLRRPLAHSLALHAVFAILTLAGGFLQGDRGPSFGDPNPLGGGSVAITPVAKIPMATQDGRRNPLANDSKTNVPPPPPKPKPMERAQLDPDAIALKSKREPKRASNEQATRQQYRPNEQQPDVTSTAGQRMTSQMYQQPGSGGVGVGETNPFGNRFGYYAALIRDRVGQRWRTTGVDQRLQTAPPVVVTFDVMRDGSVRNVRVAQSSNNYALDTSAQRAIVEAAPFPPLPAGYERDSANIEFWFQLRR